MVSLNLEDAYYSNPVNPDHTKSFKLHWKRQLYKFLVLRPWFIFRSKKLTKLMKLPIATLRINGCIVAIYIDDLINAGLVFREYVDNIMASIELLNSIGFNKCTFMPKRNITFLGLTIHSRDIKISLTYQKKDTLWLPYQTLRNNPKQTIRCIARSIGIITSSLPKVKYEGSHFKHLKKDNLMHLKILKAQLMQKLSGGMKI